MLRLLLGRLRWRWSFITAIFWKEDQFKFNGSWVQWERGSNISKQRKQRKPRGRRQKNEWHQHQPYIYFFSSWGPRIAGGCIRVLSLHACSQDAASRLMVAIVSVSNINPASTDGIESLYCLFVRITAMNPGNSNGSVQIWKIMYLAVTRGPSPSFLYTRFCVLWCTMTSGCVEWNQRISRRTAVFPM